MRTTPRFVTPSDFENYTGINLNGALKVDNSVSTVADKFLFQVEERLTSWIDAETFRNFHWDNLPSWAKECLQKAIIEQALYVLRNSEIWTDSGYDPEKLQLLDREKIYSISISQLAINQLKIGGLYNHSVCNIPRFPSWY
jgi:hypothetical protein